MSEPLPGSGWSREIVTVRNAWVFPPQESTGRPPCGVVTATGQDVLHASTWRGGIRMTRPVDAAREPADFCRADTCGAGFITGTSVTS